MNARITFCFIVLLPSCFPPKHVKKVSIMSQPFPYSEQLSFESPPPITIWIHGTRFIRRPLYHSFFRGTPSLRLAKELDADYYLHTIAHLLHQVSPSQFPMETFYLFGWSGKLRASVREEAARILYDQLRIVVQAYEHTYHQKPFIRIITHSHGGTVALNLAKIREQQLPFTIDELVLLACPVQDNTKQFVEDDMFDHTFVLYSSLDMVQIIAPQIIYNVYHTKKGRIKSRLHWPIFSKRCFDKHPKLTQIKLKMNGRALFHTEFTNKKFISYLPHIIKVIQTWHAHQIPTHETHLLCVYTKNTTTSRSSYKRVS